LDKNNNFLEKLKQISTVELSIFLTILFCLLIFVVYYSLQKDYQNREIVRSTQQQLEVYSLELENQPEAVEDDSVPINQPILTQVDINEELSGLVSIQIRAGEAVRFYNDFLENIKLIPLSEGFQDVEIAPKSTYTVTFFQKGQFLFSVNDSTIRILVGE